MHLDQHAHAQFTRAGFEFAHQSMVQRGDDQEHAIRAPVPCFIDLVRVDDEILAQRRNGAGRSGLFQIVGAALEKIHVRQYGEAGRAMRGIALCDLGGLKIFTKNALGRRGLFDFSNHACLAGRDFLAQAGLEASQLIARFPVGLDIAAQAGEVLVFFSRADFVGFDVENFVQDIGHGCLTSWPVAG